MTDYKPGTVAVICWSTDSGRERAISNGDSWMTEGGVKVHTSNVTDVRPLVVLDPEDSSVKSFVRRHTDGSTGNAACAYSKPVARLIEAQTKPPRIPEPGLWAVVESGAGRIPIRRWVHHEEGWWVADTGDRLFWEDLDDPTLVREGV